jgi:hypothetical protein
MTSTTDQQEIAHATDVSDKRGKFENMSRASIVWDRAEKGYLTDAERTAKNLDVEGKGHLSREQAVALGSQYQSLKEDNKQIKKQLYGLAILCVLLFMGTVAGTVMAVKNSKDTIVDMKTGVMKVNGGTGVDIVTVKAQGLTFKTNGSIEGEEEYIDPDTNITSSVKVKSYCVPAEDVVSMWLANEQGTDARLVILEDFDDAGTNTEISSVKHVTSGDASWKKDHIVMGGMTFTPSEECADFERRRMLLQENNDIDVNIDMQSPFDSISIHRALKQHVDFLSGRDLSDDGGKLPKGEYVVIPPDCIDSCVKDRCEKWDLKCPYKFGPICEEICEPPPSKEDYYAKKTQKPTKA